MIEKYLRTHLKGLQPYRSARDIYKGNGYIFLDANENPLIASEDRLERYPDPSQSALRMSLGARINIPEENLFFGVGSDEIIDLLVKLFCDPGKSEALTAEPTYGMYRTVCDIHNVRLNSILLEKETFDLNAEKLLKAVTPETKIIFLCSPNNPTGNLLNREEILKVVRGFGGPVVIDEAYIDFSNTEGMLYDVLNYSNLCVMRTFSKAFGLAGARIGYLVGDTELVSWLFKIKAPYSINKLTEQKALEVLAQYDVIMKKLATVTETREKFASIVRGLPFVEKIYPSDSNFLLMKVTDPNGLCDSLAEKGVIVRDRSSQPLLDGCVRISIGTTSEMTTLLEALGVENDKVNLLLPEATTNTGRRGVTFRVTKETRVRVEVLLDEPGKAEIATGIGFFDHMLDQIARHGNMGLRVNVLGDLHVDEHHTVEDTGIALGEAIINALGNKAGIQRYGFYLPMDDSEAICSLDLGGRIRVKFKARFKREKVGDLPVELVEEFFNGVAAGMKANIVIRANGKNDHHKIEAIFKAFAKALNEAARKDERTLNFLPSTKGVL